MHKLSDLSKRFAINSFFGVIVILLLLFLNHPQARWLFVPLLILLGCVALWEYFQLLRKKGLFPPILLGLSALAAYLASGFLLVWGPKTPFTQLLPFLILGVALLACFVFYALRQKDPLVHIATTYFGLLYIGVPLSCFIFIAYFSLEGNWWLGFLIVVTKLADMGGYFLGRAFGKRKLALRVSPNKTLEGAIGGWIAAILGALILYLLGRQFGVFLHYSLWQALLLGLLIGFVGQAGDLAESLLKRDAKVKDSNAIPGVGGVLDMVDSLLLTAPLLYFFLKIWG